jgi:Protein of unknown function (DUF3224)
MVTNLKLEIKSWDEEPYRELPEGQKLARASTTLVGSEVDLTATMTTLLHYLADGTSTYVSLLSFEGRLGERTGSFALHGSGTYDGAEAKGSFTVTPGSGTGELAGIRGNAVSVSTHADYPFMPLTLDYELG